MFKRSSGSLVATQVVRGLALGGAGALTLALAVSACETLAGNVGPGGECFLATDCALGLVCVEQQNGARICTDDVARVAGRRPPDAAADSDAEAGLDEAGTPDGEAPDVVVEPPPPQDSGPDVAPPPDTGAPPDDAGGD